LSLQSRVFVVFAVDSTVVVAGRLPDLLSHSPADEAKTFLNNFNVKTI
jgi:hypothetical protein